MENIIFALIFIIFNFILKKKLNVSISCFILITVITTILCIFLEPEILFILLIFSLFYLSIMYLTKLRITKKKKTSLIKNFIYIFLYIAILLIISIILNKTKSNTSLIHIIILTSVTFIITDVSSREFGRIINTHTYLINNFRKVRNGISGGISIGGSLSSLFICILFVFTTNIVLNYNLKIVSLIIVLGYFTNFIDSFLGATLELNKYVTNELVNLISLILLTNIIIIFSFLI